MPGFIQDQLEIKFLILYIAARVVEPVPFDTILDLTLCDDAIDYFEFSDCLADLVRTGHLTLSADGLYASLTLCVSAAIGIWRGGTGSSAVSGRCGLPPSRGPTGLIP